jgi:hypothetical protein
MNLQATSKQLTFALSLLSLCALPTLAQDLTVTAIGDDVDGRNIEYYGNDDGVLSYNFTATICNGGDQPVAMGGRTEAHPVVGQNLYRIMDGRIEQIGQGFAKHHYDEFLDVGSCGTCSGSVSATGLLNPGCSETYGAQYINYGPDGFGYDEDGPKYQVNPTTGAQELPFLYPPCAAGWLGDHVSHIEVDALDIDPNINAGAVFVAEAQVIAVGDAQAGNGDNNASFRLLQVHAVDNIVPIAGWGTGVGLPAIYLYPWLYPEALLTEVVNEDEGGLGIDSRLYVACNVIELPNGLYRYEYAVQNLDSHQGIRSFSLPADCAYLQLSDFDQHHVDYGCGEIWQSDNWATSLNGGVLKFSTGAFTGQEATGFSYDSSSVGDPSPIRWGTMSNFAFTATTPPQEVEVELGLFRPGSTMSLTAITLGPCAAAECSAVRYCGEHGVANSGGSIAAINFQGSTSVSQNNCRLYCNSIPANQWGIFFYGPEELAHPLGGGTLCIGGAIFRINPAVQANGSGLALTQLDLTSGSMGSGPGQITAGSTWNFQFWYRDPAGPTYSGFNFTDAMRINFCQ